MNETKKTSIFLAVALFLGVVALALRPSHVPISSDKMLGKTLFEKFNDPLSVKGLDIVRFNAAKGDIEEFRIADSISGAGGGVWAIPSHEGYPADAKDQMAAVAAALVDLKVLSVAAADSAGTPAKTHAMYGVLDPTKDSVSENEGDIGLKIVLTAKDDSNLVDLIVGKPVEDKDGIRYVRVAGSDPVFTVKLSTDRFSTKFEDWIEKNVLDIQSWDIRKVAIDDYTVDITQGTQSPQGNVVFEINPDDEPKWRVLSYETFKDDKFVPVELAANLEPNAAILDAMLSAFDSLKIVDVAKKPEPLAKALRDSKPLPLDETSQISLASTGFYLVRVPDSLSPMLLSNDGELTLSTKDGVQYVLRFGQLTGTESETEKDGETKEMTANRYLFVMAQLDETAIAPMQLQGVPDPLTEGEPSAIEARAKEIVQIEKANQREKDRFDAAMAAGKKRIDELNHRFANWYFVISDDVYKKIRISKNDLFSEKAKTEETKTETPPKTETRSDSQFPAVPGLGGLFPVE